MADKALGINAKMALGLKTRSELFVLRAKSLKTEPERALAEASSKKDLAAALQQNPLLQKELDGGIAMP